VSDIRLHVAADASFLINLFATQLAVELIDFDRLSLVVPTVVYDEMKRNRAELDGLVAQGRARVVELPREALRYYVEAASVVNDGEAAAIALGISMQIGIATDDGCAVDYWTEAAIANDHQVIGICELLRAAETSLNIQRLRDALVRVRRDANFAPPRHHSEWWSRVLNGNR
jgi:predicted nucleic acid-binding protein